MKKMMKDIATGSDNQTYAIARVIGLVTFVLFTIVTGVALWRAHEIDIQGWCIGAAALLGALGIAIGFTRKSEPCPKEDPPNGS